MRAILALVIVVATCFVFKGFCPSWSEDQQPAAPASAATSSVSDVANTPDPVLTKNQDALAAQLVPVETGVFRITEWLPAGAGSSLTRINVIARLSSDDYGQLGTSENFWVPKDYLREIRNSKSGNFTAFRAEKFATGQWIPVPWKEEVMN